MFSDEPMRGTAATVGPTDRSPSPLQQMQLVDHIVSFADVFVLDNSELGSTTVVEHSIYTGDLPPIQQPARRVCTKGQIGSSCRGDAVTSCCRVIHKPVG